MFLKTDVDIKHIDFQNNKNFEQMITIYSNKKTHQIDKKHIIIFLMGSAWLGHNKLLYSITNFWNSILLKKLANRGYTTICIRHRGAFFRPIKFSNKYNKFIMFFLFITNIFLFLFYIIMLNCYNYICNDSASYNDILNDIEKSVNYLNNNLDNIFQDESKKNIIFIGYSSGVQVLNTFMINNNIDKYKNLDIKYIIYISGVLNLYKNINNRSYYLYFLFKNVVKMYISIIFGENTKLLSCYDNIDFLPKKKYYIIGCKNEFLHIPLIKQFSELLISNKNFYERLKINFDAKYFELLNNHWNILLSKKLIDIIENIE